MRLAVLAASLAALPCAAQTAPGTTPQGPVPIASFVTQDQFAHLIAAEHIVSIRAGDRGQFPPRARRDDDFIGGELLQRFRRGAAQW